MNDKNKLQSITQQIKDLDKTREKIKELMLQDSEFNINHVYPIGLD